MADYRDNKFKTGRDDSKPLPKANGYWWQDDDAKKTGERVLAVNGHPVQTVEEAQLELLRIYGAGTPLSLRLEGQLGDVSWPVTAETQRSRPVHPAQLYSLIDGLLLCFLLLAYEPYKKRDGELTALLLTIHPISRFLLEIIRVDEASVFETGMSISQNISIAVFVGGVLLWIYLFVRRPRPATWPATVALATS